MHKLNYFFQQNNVFSEYLATSLLLHMHVGWFGKIQDTSFSSYVVPSQIYWTSMKLELFLPLEFASHFLLDLFTVILVRHGSMILSWNKFGTTMYLVIIGWRGPDSKCWRTREADWKADKGERSFVFVILQIWSLDVTS